MEWFFNNGVEYLHPSTFEEESEECLICREATTDDNEPHVVKIIHTFHQTCLAHWLGASLNHYQATCPCCRTVLYTNTSRNLTLTTDEIPNILGGTALSHFIGAIEELFTPEAIYFPEIGLLDQDAWFEEESIRGDEYETSYDDDGTRTVIGSPLRPEPSSGTATPDGYIAPLTGGQGFGILRMRSMDSLRSVKSYGSYSPNMLDSIMSTMSHSSMRSHASARSTRSVREVLMARSVESAVSLHDDGTDLVTFIEESEDMVREIDHQIQYLKSLRDSSESVAFREDIGPRIETLQECVYNLKEAIRRRQG